MSVMIVDDDEGARAALASTLRARGHAVAPYEDGRSAIEALTVDGVDRPDVILLGGASSGVEAGAFLAALAQHEALTSIPVVLLAATPDPAPLPGVFVILEQPYEVDDLTDAVDAAHLRAARAATMTAA